jgi:hypothetical protein
MLQIRKLVLRGIGVMDATETFCPGGNIVAGESDTGKSYLLRCLDYIFGADKLKSPIPKAQPYSDLFVEFENSAGEFITLRRSLSGGGLAVHRCRIDEIDGPGETITAKRTKKKGAEDVTSVLFPFAGIPEAELRKNVRGEKQRLSMRMFLPIFLIDEVAVIDLHSPVLGRSGFGETPQKRMLSFMLSGKDDAGIVPTGPQEIAKVRSSAQLGVITELLGPLQERASRRSLGPTPITNDAIEDEIAHINEELSSIAGERSFLFRAKESSEEHLRRSESQIMALDELLTRYQLLDSRYSSDLERLDFVAEGAHYFNGLQEVRCPLCDQLMDADHSHSAEATASDVYLATKAEAGKILGHRADLSATIEAVSLRRKERVEEAANALANIARIEERLSQIVIPSFDELTSRLDALVDFRIGLELARNDSEQIRTLNAIKQQIEKALEEKEEPGTWEQLPTKPLNDLCSEIEAVLDEWSWNGPGRVEFDQKEFDIIVDGQSRQSHGKGVRAVLYSAFAIGLLRYCKRFSKPHPGMVVIDSPLTSYKKGKPSATGDGPVDPGIEASFWSSLTKLGSDVQVIVVENKEPPQHVAEMVNYLWFPGDTAKLGERAGLIPN